MRLYKLNKSVLLFRNNAAEFLNGLTSNEITKPQNTFVNIHAKIIATFDQYKIDDEEVLIVLEPAYKTNVLDHVKRYCALSGVKVEELERNVYFDLEGNFPIQTGGLKIPQRKGSMIVTNQDLKSNVSDEEFTLFRLKNNIPVHGVDYKDEMLLNVDMKYFVSFTKGCFLGQEPISKVYNRSKPTWRLVVKLENSATEEEKNKMTSKTMDPSIHQVLGFVFEENK